MQDLSNARGGYAGLQRKVIYTDLRRDEEVLAQDRAGVIVRSTRHPAAGRAMISDLLIYTALISANYPLLRRASRKEKCFCARLLNLTSPSSPST